MGAVKEYYHHKQKEIDSQTFVEPDGLTKNKNFWEIIFNQKILL